MGKMWFIYTLDFSFHPYRRMRVMLLVEKQMQLEMMILSKLNQPEKGKSMLSFNGVFSINALLY